MVAAAQLCQPRARFSFTADCGSQPEAKTSPCLVVLRVDIALLPQRRLSLQFNLQIQLQNHNKFRFPMYKHDLSVRNCRWLYDLRAFCLPAYIAIFLCNKDGENG